MPCEPLPLVPPCCYLSRMLARDRLAVAIIMCDPPALESGVSDRKRVEPVEPSQCGKFGSPKADAAQRTEDIEYSLRIVASFQLLYV